MIPLSAADVAPCLSSPTLLHCIKNGLHSTDAVDMCQSRYRLRSILGGSHVPTSSQRRQQSSGYESSVGLPSSTARAFGRRARSTECRDESESTQMPYDHKRGSTVHTILAYSLEGAIPKTWRDKEHSNIFWQRNLTSGFQPSRVWIVALSYDANLMWQDWSKPNTSRYKRQKLLLVYMYVAAQDAGASEHRMDSRPQKVDRIMQGRDQVRVCDVENHYRFIPHCWDRQEINNKSNAAITTIVCKDASNTSSDYMLLDSYKASLEQVIVHDSPNIAASPCYRDPAGFPRYREICKFLGSLIYPLVALRCPTTVSAAALSWNCNPWHNGMSSISLSSLNIYSKLTRIVEPAALDSPMDSKVLSMPWFPARNISQYLAFCSGVLLLVYLQGSGKYLKHSFMASSGLLALICVLAGTEMMLRFLPVVVLVTLLASWGCQVFVKIIWGLPCHEVEDESLANSSCAPKTVLAKDSKFSVTKDIFIDL